MTAPARVLALHAATRDRHDFAGLVAALPAFTVETVDILGHGGAPRRPYYTIDLMVEAVDLGADRPILYGHSLGGLVALAAAARSPERIRALVLEDAPLFEAMMPRLAESPFYRGFQGLKSVMTGRAKDYALSDWEREVAGWPSGHHGRTMLEAFGPDGVAMRARQLFAFDHHVLDGLLDGSLTRGYDAIANLRAASLPVAYIAGAREHGSAIAPDDVARLAAEPNVTVHRVAEEGHFIHEVLAARCADIVKGVVDL
ncbi:alpha/beta hydrolase [Acuticoccus sp. M5D2P5]|uniref:alpha/beta fold hydrolase n=1 Tax=Acuticoccus kalidii TaxID=2910977 RepID=UPI001F25A5E4|nr:alpha/beta fold hydrolase [Acuticoccus kalidii]MCF3935867.1 alpha/beta hydrolase [Acuticoccus kalidii]